MKKIFDKIIATVLSFLVLTTIGCSSDFLDDNLKNNTLPAGNSTICISPEWESGDYQFYLPGGMGNSDFKIESKPSWLRIDAMTGKLVNSVATVRCSATKNPGFEKMGVYFDKMKVSVGKQDFNVLVAYISEGNPVVKVRNSVVVGDYSSLEIGNSGAGLLVWDIVSFPDWLTIDWNRFGEKGILDLIVPQNSSFQLPLTINNDADLNLNMKGKIVLRTNDKNNPTVEIEVTANFENPEINVWNSDVIDFGAVDITSSLSISAWGSGLLVWQFEELPEWLTITPSKGVYHTHTYYEDIIFTCDRTKLQPGLNSSVIYLKSNARNKPSIAFTVTARAAGDNTNVRSLEGNVVDVAFDKKSNTLYYVTSLPNKLVTYDMASRAVLRELQLSKAPTCFAVSEDYTKAALGHDEQLSMVNLDNWSVTNKDVSGTVYDIAWGADDWFCYTKDGNSALHWINTNDLTIYQTSNGYLYDGRSVIKKVPGKPYVIATRRGLSPSGFFVFSTSTKELKSYSHMALSNFWFSQNGEYTFGLSRDVYRTSSATDSDDTFSNEDVISIGRLQGNNPGYIRWLEHSSSSHSIWAIGDDFEHSNIYQFEDNNYTLQKYYPYFDIYQPDTQTAAYEVEALYVFSNKEDTELLLLRKGINNNNWSIEFIQLTP